MNIADTRSKGQPLLLLVDDAPASLKMLARILQGSYRLKLATSGSVALKLAHGDPQPDMVLLDLHMPGMDGIEVLSKLRLDDKTRGIPVIFVTAENSDTLESTGIELGADDYITKPVAPPVLLARVQGVLRRRVAETALKQSEEQFRTLFETMAQGVLYHDAEGKIVQANPASQHILGWTLSQMQGKTPMDPQWHVIHRDGSPFPGEEHPASVALATGQPVKEVLMGVFHPGHKNYAWILVSAMPRVDFVDSRLHGVFATFTDVTTQVNMEQEQALFLRMLTHEVRTPLAIIDSNCQLLSLDHCRDTEANNILPIRAAVARLAELFDRCLSQDQLVSIGKPKLAPVDLATLLTIVSQEVQRRTDDHLVTLRIGSLPLHIMGDATLLQIMLTNLLDNAVRYSPEGGVIELVALADNVGKVVIEVRDEGVGIPEADLDHIFQRYFRTHQVGDTVGAGLGLYIVKNIARLHSGDVVCESTLGEGSVFRVTLKF